MNLLQRIKTEQAVRIIGTMQSNLYAAANRADGITKKSEGVEYTLAERKRYFHEAVRWMNRMMNIATAYPNEYFPINEPHTADNLCRNILEMSLKEFNAEYRIGRIILPENEI